MPLLKHFSYPVLRIIILHVVKKLSGIFIWMGISIRGLRREKLQHPHRHEKKKQKRIKKKVNIKKMKQKIIVTTISILPRCSTAHATKKNNNRFYFFSMRKKNILHLTSFETATPSNKTTLFNWGKCICFFFFLLDNISLNFSSLLCFKTHVLLECFKSLLLNPVPHHQISFLMPCQKISPHRMISFLLNFQHR